MSSTIRTSRPRDRGVEVLEDADDARGVGRGAVARDRHEVELAGHLEAGASGRRGTGRRPSGSPPAGPSSPVVAADLAASSVTRRCRSSSADEDLADQLVALHGAESMDGYRARRAIHRGCEQPLRESVAALSTAASAAPSGAANSSETATPGDPGDPLARGDDRQGAPQRAGDLAVREEVLEGLAAAEAERAHPVAVAPGADDELGLERARVQPRRRRLPRAPPGGAAISARTSHSPKRQVPGTARRWPRGRARSPGPAPA